MLAPWHDTPSLAAPSISVDLWHHQLWSCDCATQRSRRLVKTPVLMCDSVVTNMAEAMFLNHFTLTWRWVSLLWKQRTSLCRGKHWEGFWLLVFDAVLEFYLNYLLPHFISVQRCTKCIFHILFAHKLLSFWDGVRVLLTSGFPSADRARKNISINAKISTELTDSFS